MWSFYLPSVEQAQNVLAAMQAEGLPVGKVYGGKPVYAAQQILNQATLTGGCPFNCATAFS